MQSAPRWFSSRRLALGAVTISVLLAAVTLVAGANAWASGDGLGKPTAQVTGGASAADTGGGPLVASAALRGPVPKDATKPGSFDIDRDSAGRPYVAGHVLVSYTARATKAQKGEVANDADARFADRFGGIDAQLLKVPAIKDAGPRALRRTLRGIEAEPWVESASPDYIDRTEATFNDQYYPLQWALPRIGAPQAWDRTLGRNTVIADLDTGLPPDNLASCNLNAGHEDIGGVIAQGDFVNNDVCPEDNVGHGTETAGVEAAVTGNGVGISGTSPQGLLEILKVCETAGIGCPVSAQIAALDALANPPSGIPIPDVVNMSLGGHGTPPQAQHDAINLAVGKGIVVVASAGNENTDDPSYPAAFPEAIAVGATSIADAKSDFSNFGSWVDIVAPGGDGSLGFDDIFSTVPFQLNPNGYTFTNGTSFSAPYVSGVASLIAASGRDAAHIRYRLEHGAKDLGAPGKDDTFGYGLLDADDATLPPDQTRACKAANFAVGLAKAADDKARRKLKKAKRKLRKAKRKLSQAHHNHDLNPGLAKKKLRKAKKKAKKAKKAAKAADAGLAQAQTDAQTPCNA